MHLSRRNALFTLAASTTALAGFSARAQDTYPNRPINLVVPLAAGGSVDIAGRLMADYLARAMGQPFVVENRAGASGAIASTYVAHQPADGYTLIVLNQTSHVFNPALNPKLPYDTLRDFVPITLIDRQANVLLVNPALPVKSFAEFIQYARKHPAQLNYATSGIGSVAHLSVEVLKKQAGIDLTHVPYKGSSQAASDLQAGLVQVTWMNLSSAVGSIRAGKLRPLAVASPGRAPQIPDVPTFAELKYPDLNMTSWNGIGAPTGTPEPIVQKIYAAMRKVHADPAAQKQWVERGMIVPEAVTPAQYRQEIAQRIAYFAALAKSSNITLD